MGNEIKNRDEHEKERNKNFRLAIYELVGLALAVIAGDEFYTCDDFANEILQIMGEHNIFHRI